MNTRIIVGLMALAVLLLVTGCGGGAAIEEQGDEPLGAGIDEEASEPDSGLDSGGSATDEGEDELEPERVWPYDYVTHQERIEPVYIPYVEDVVIPNTIISGQPFEVTLRLSTALKPELLNGISREYALPQWQYSGDTSIGLTVYLGDNPSDYAPVYEHAVEFHPHYVRDHKDTLRIQTADSPEWGGLEVLMNITAGFAHPHEHLVWREYPINVVPAEE